MTETRGKGTFRLYNNGGVPLVAVMLRKIFTPIETDADKVRHNDALEDVLDILSMTEPAEKYMLTEEEDTLFTKIAEWLLYPRQPRRKRFLFRVAEWIMDLGNKKG